MKVLKFGGTSMGSVESLKKVADIIADNFENKVTQVVVCSAMSGVTDKLFEIGELAEQSKLEAALKIFKKIKKLHFETAYEFRVAETFHISIDPVFEDLENIIKGLSMIHELSPRSEAYLTAFGEKLSTRLLTEILKTKSVTAIQLDSNFIRTEGANFEEDDVCWEETNKLVSDKLTPLLKNNQVPIVTGFFGTNEKDIISLLGRGGSDYSAAILAVGLKTKTVEIWTDVDGFLSADPRIVPHAHLIPEIGFTEASELCSFGAKVLHPKTIRPIIDRNGEVWIKNTFNPQSSGTLIIKKAENICHSVLSVTSKPTLILSLDLFGISMGTPKSVIYAEIFNICNKYSIFIDMVASSEAEISFCISPNKKSEAFIEDLKKVAPLTIAEDKSILCVVSPSYVKGRVGIAAGFFQALKSSGISIEMYSQNNSEIAQLMVVKTSDEKKAIMAIHDQFAKGDCSL